MLRPGLSAMGSFCSDAANQHLFLLLLRSFGREANVAKPSRQRWHQGWVGEEQRGAAVLAATAMISSSSEERCNTIAGTGLHLILEAFSSKLLPPFFPSLSGTLRGQRCCCCGWVSVLLSTLTER